MTPDGLHLHLGGYGRKVNPTPPTRGVADHQPTSLMYIFCDLFVDVQHQEPNANLAWPEPLQPRHDAPTPVWLVTTDNQCAKAVEHAPLSNEWGVVLVAAGQRVPQGLRRDPAVIEASRVLTRIPCPPSCDSWYLTRSASWFYALCHCEANQPTISVPITFMQGR